MEVILETCPALEYPFWAERRMIRNTGKEPTEDIVLLDHVWIETHLPREFHDLLPNDHSFIPFFIQFSGTHNLHLEISLSAGSAESSLAFTFVSPDRHARRASSYLVRGSKWIINCLFSVLAVKYSDFPLHDSRIANKEYS